jgi:hypothetical protein
MWFSCEKWPMSEIKNREFSSVGPSKYPTVHIIIYNKLNKDAGQKNV